MRITAITVNAAGMAAETGIRGTGSTGVNRTQAENVFSAECKVTISQKGKELSNRQRQADRAEKTAQGVQAERMLRRSQEEAERDKSIKEEYCDRLDEIDKKISALNSSYDKKKDRDETIGKQQEVLRAMRNLKAFQAEQGQRLEKEARQAAMQSSKYQNEIDENNRDLLTLLKTMEEAENAEEERENGGAAESGAGSGNAVSGAVDSVGDVIRNSSAHYMMSSAEREWDIQEAIAGLGDEGRRRLKLADTITRNVLDTTKNIRMAMGDELYTDEQIAKMMMLLEDGTTKPGLAEEFRKRGWKMGMDLNYDDVEYLRGWGLQNLEDARDAKIQHLGDNTARNVQETKKGMMLSAVDAALGEARQDSLDKASRELEEEVERLIDERNDVDRRNPEPTESALYSEREMELHDEALDEWDG